MEPSAVRQLLTDVRDERLSPEEAANRLRTLPFEDIGFAKLDHHRRLRLGLPEVIYAAGKTPDETAEIFVRMVAHGGNVLATRGTPEHAAAVRERVPSAEYHPRARTIFHIQGPSERGKGEVAVLCAGTSDLGVAEEAVTTARVMGNRVRL